MIISWEVLPCLDIGIHRKLVQQLGMQQAQHMAQLFLDQ